MKFEINDKVKTKRMIKATAIVKDRLVKPEVNLYQVEILEGSNKNDLLWFAEHELEKSE